MKNLCFYFSVVVIGVLTSCNGSGNGNKKNNDSAYSGLEGTRENASQLSNATIDTSSGQNSKKLPVATDSSLKYKKDPVK
jgi:hypothetical protein